MVRPFVMMVHGDGDDDDDGDGDGDGNQYSIECNAKIAINAVIWTCVETQI
jgi:hypothetical protein